MKNHYEVLRIGQQATEEEITESYRLLAQMYHPDRFAGNERKCREANEMMRELNEAYQTLRDPVRRQAYDQKLNPFVPRRPAGDQARYSAAHSRTTTSAFRRVDVPPVISEEQRARAWANVQAARDERNRRQQVGPSVPTNKPMDLLASLLRPFHYIGLFVVVAGQVLAWGGLVLLIVSFVSSFVFLWLEFNRLVPPELGDWAARGVDLGWTLIVFAFGATLLPLVWIFKLFETVNPVLYYLIAAAIIFVSIKFAFALARHAFGLPKPARQSWYASYSERLSLFSIFGALWTIALIHGVFITGLLR